MARLQLVEPRGEPLVRVGRDEVRLPRAFGCPSACFLGVTLTSAHALRFLPHDVTVAQRSTWAGDLRGGVFSRAGRSDASSPQQSTLASRFYQIKTGHSVRAVPQLDEEPTHPAMLVVPVPEPDSGAPLQGVSGVEDPAKDPVGRGAEGNWEVEGIGGRSGTSWRTRGAAGRYWTFSILRMWEGGCRLRRTQ